MSESATPEKQPEVTQSDDANIRELRTTKGKFMRFYYNAVPYFTLNVAWFVMSLPVVTIFPALGGLYYAVLQMNQEHGADWGTVWEGLKKHWWLSVRWGLLVVGVDALLAVNIWFYYNLTQDWAVFALTATVVLLIIWLAINQFSFPLLLLQDEKKIFTAIRNGYVVVMRQPLAALKVMGLNLLIAVVSILLPPLWVFISMAAIVSIRTRTVIQAVEKIRAIDADRDAAKANRESVDLDLDEDEPEDGEDLED